MPGSPILRRGQAVFSAPLPTALHRLQIPGTSNTGTPRRVARIGPIDAFKSPDCISTCRASSPWRSQTARRRRKLLFTSGKGTATSSDGRPKYASTRARGLREGSSASLYRREPRSAGRRPTASDRRRIAPSTIAWLNSSLFIGHESSVVVRNGYQFTWFRGPRCDLVPGHDLAHSANRDNRCAMTRHPHPRARTFSTICCSVIVSSALVASSSTSRLGCAPGPWQFRDAGARRAEV